MPGIGIDWVSAAIIVAAYLFSLVRQVPPRVRYFVVAGALAIIAVYRWRLGGTGLNAVMPFVAAGLCVWHLVKAFRSPR